MLSNRLSQPLRHLRVRPTIHHITRRSTPCTCTSTTLIRSASTFTSTSESTSSSSSSSSHQQQQGYGIHATLVLATVGLIATAVQYVTTPESTSTPTSPKMISRRIDKNTNDTTTTNTTTTITTTTSTDNNTTSTSRTLILPSTAPTWLHEIAQLSTHTYRHLSDYYDMSDHLIFDALRGRGGVQSYYYFTPNQMIRTIETPPPPTTQPPPSPAGSIVPGPPETLTAPSLVLEKQAARASASSQPSSPPHPAREHKRMGCESGEILAVFELGSGVCGHRGIVHGGLTAALMDEVCGATTYLACGYGAFTANLNVNYIHPLPAEGYILVRAHVDEVQGRKTYVNVSVTDGLNGKTYANGRALFVRPKYMMPPSIVVSATQ